MHEALIFNYHFIQLTRTTLLRSLDARSARHMCAARSARPIKNGAHSVDPMRGRPKCKTFILKFIHFFPSPLHASAPSPLRRQNTNTASSAALLKAGRRRNFAFSAPGERSSDDFSFRSAFIVQNSKANGNQHTCEAKHTVQ